LSKVGLQIVAQIMSSI